MWRCIVLILGCSVVSGLNIKQYPEMRVMHGAYGQEFSNEDYSDAAEDSYGLIMKGEKKGDAYLMLAIPKTAAATVAKTFKKEPGTWLPKSASFFSEETCFSALEEKAKARRNGHTKIFTFLREPTMHVYAQYHQSCVQRACPGIRNFHEYVQYFAKTKDKRGRLRTFYSSYNMQTRALTCDNKGHGGSHLIDTNQDLMQAEANLQKLFFVGLQEHYKESLCVMHAKIENEVPAWCNCENKAYNWNAKLPVEEHLPANHKFSDIDESTLRMLKNFTDQDEKLYAHARGLFMQQVWETEEKFNTTIMCKNHKVDCVLCPKKKVSQATTEILKKLEKTKAKGKGKVKAKRKYASEEEHHRAHEDAKERYKEKKRQEHADKSLVWGKQFAKWDPTLPMNKQSVVASIDERDVLPDVRSVRDPFDNHPQSLAQIQSETMNWLPPQADAIERMHKKPNPVYNYMHIPKTGGSTIVKMLRRAGIKLHVAEKPFCAVTQAAPIITFMREPGRHVLAQFTHCSDSPQHAFARDKMPKDFPSFIKGWYEQNKSSPFEIPPAKYCCYNPTNMQARFASCNPKIAQTDAAYENILHKAAFVGISELFQESMCVLKYKSGLELGPECDCQNREAWEASYKLLKAKSTGQSHPRQISDFDAKTRQQLEFLVQKDHMLYGAAYTRLVAEINVIQQKTGMKIMCQTASPKAFHRHKRNMHEIDVDDLVDLDYGELEMGIHGDQSHAKAEFSNLGSCDGNAGENGLWSQHYSASDYKH